MKLFFGKYVLALVAATLTTMTIADDTFTLSSPSFVDGGVLSDDLKCTRDGGDGVSPALSWVSAPEGTESLAVIMHHYPRGAVAGRDEPSHYWLLWNIPTETTSIAMGNPLSIGDEGSNKDRRDTGYTSPCSPLGSQHAYTITLYALDRPLDSLPQNDALSVDWQAMITAMDGKKIASTEITFIN